MPDSQAVRDRFGNLSFKLKLVFSYGAGAAHDHLYFIFAACVPEAWMTLVFCMWLFLRCVPLFCGCICYELPGSLNFEFSF